MRRLTLLCGALIAFATACSGADGADGTNGTDGTDGTDGNTILNGTGAPSNAVGANGDFYIDTAAHSLYGPKAAGAWPASGTSLIGPPGTPTVTSGDKDMTLNAPGFANIMSVPVPTGRAAGGRISYTIEARSADGQVATEQGVVQWLATTNSVTCSVQTDDKIHLGTVNSGCTPGFFNPGSQPGVSIFDNVSFNNPSAIAYHHVWFSIVNNSGSTVRLE